MDQQRKDDLALLDGLRRRQLFEVAESFCYRQLKKPDLDPTSQATLTIELMKTQMTKAILTDSASRDEAWQAVQQTHSDFEQAFPQHPRIFLVQVQLALSYVAHARLMRQEIDAEMAKDSAGTDALNQIRLARSLLKKLQRDITGAIPDQRGRSLTQHDLDSEQLLNLNNNIQFQLAACNLIRAQLYPEADRLNRIDALNTVSQRLGEVQRSSSDGQPLWWKTKLGQIECLRLLGNLDGARSLAKSLDSNKPPTAVGVSLLEQKARLAAELGNEDYARNVLNEFNESNSRTAELELAIVQLAVELAARATTDTRKQEWIAFAANLSQSMEQTYGGYWRRRADLLLISATGVANGNTDAAHSTKSDHVANSATSSSTPVELELLIRLADEAARKENLDDALKAYDRASKLALSLNESEQALQVDYRAGKILEQQSLHRLAAERLTTSARRDSSLAFAPSAHLIGCWNFAKSLKTDADRQPFQTLLRDHLRLWPAGTNANQVRVWLARELQVKKMWQAAFETYLNIQNDSPLLEKSIDQGLACARRQLLTEQQAGRSTRAMVSILDAKMSKKADSFSNPDPAADKLTLGRVELELVFGSRKPNPNWIQELKFIQDRSQPATANAAKVLRAVSFCISDPDSAQALISEIAADESALELGERCLIAMIDESASNELQSIRALRLKLIDTALANPGVNQSGHEQKKTRWRLKRSTALAELGRHSDAVTVLTELEQQFPRNAAVQMQLARAMTAQYATSDPQKPLDKWRRIAARLKPHTPNWFEAKHEVARLLLTSGDATGATKLLKYIQANPPGWNNSTLKPKFEQLLRDSDNK